MHLHAAGETDRGLVRPVNEDAILLDGDLQLFAVADGMGGHAAGKVASSLAVEVLREAVRELLSDTVPAEACPSSVRSTFACHLAAAVRRAGQAIYRAACEHPEQRGMGTTVAAALRVGPTLAVAHVGDSRVYRLREAGMVRLTEDHSLVAEQVRQGVLTPREAEQSRNRNLLTRALGYRPDVIVDLAEFPLRDGDRFLLCTDGLSALVPDGHILSILEETDGSAAACCELIRAAKDAGGTDNISALVLEVLNGEPCPCPAGASETQNGGDPC